MVSTPLVAEPVQRSLSLDLIPPTETRQAIINSIRRYRHACRQLFAVVGVGQMACAGLVESDEPDQGIRFAPENDAAKIALAAVMGKARIEKGEKQRGAGQTYQVNVGSGFAYELRDYFREHLYPTAMSFVWDSARRDVTTAWTAKDPEFTRASRGWLAMQGARGLARFDRRGIGFPRATARPKLRGHTLTLKWDHDIDAVEFAVPRLDGGRYVVWKRLRDQADGWKLGTVYLTERQGKVYATLTYSCPDRKAELDEGSVCQVFMDADGDTLFRIFSKEAAFSFDEIDAAEVTAWLGRMQARKIELERRRAACGNPRRPWGHRRGWRGAQDVLSNLTRQRALGFTDRLHAWTRRIVQRALSWRCAYVLVAGPLTPELRGHPWPQTQFFALLKYKCEFHGIKLCRSESLVAPTAEGEIVHA